MTSSDKSIHWSPRLHKWMGILMLAPLCVWAITGGVFLIKPGYEQAYEQLSIPTYKPQSNDTRLWATEKAQLLVERAQESRRLNTVVGEHLLLKTDDKWLQVDSVSGQQRQPSEIEVRQLMMDAFKANPVRYGEIISLEELEAVTDTNVVVTLDWDTMSLKQKGDDTRLIKRLYKLHYLQWTGRNLVDRIFGIAGLLSLLTLTVLGIRLLFFRHSST